MRTCITACMSSMFSQIRLLTAELAAVERLNIDVSTLFSVAIDPTSIRLGGHHMQHQAYVFLFS